MENVRVCMVDVVPKDNETGEVVTVLLLIESRNDVSVAFLLELDLGLLCLGRAGVPEQGCCL